MDNIIRKLQSINQTNGYLFNVTDVVLGNCASDAKTRGIALQKENGSVIVHCNATTKTLEQLNEYITKVLDEEFVITGDGIDEPFVVTPKQTDPTDDTEESGTDATT